MYTAEIELNINIMRKRMYFWNILEIRSYFPEYRVSQKKGGFFDFSNISVMASISMDDK